MTRTWKPLAIAAVMAAAGASMLVKAQQPAAADIVLTGGKVITVGADRATIRSRGGGCLTYYMRRPRPGPWRSGTWSGTGSRWYLEVGLSRGGPRSAAH